METADALRLLPSDDKTKKIFFEYFDNGMGIAESSRYHRSIFDLYEESGQQTLASGRLNPSQRKILYWHDEWRILNLGPRNGEGLIVVC